MVGVGRIAAGYGMATVTSSRIRSGASRAASYAASAPQSWPTTIARSSPSAAINSTRSRARAARR